MRFCQSLHERALPAPRRAHRRSRRRHRRRRARDRVPLRPVPQDHEPPRVRHVHRQGRAVGRRRGAHRGHRLRRGVLRRRRCSRCTASRSRASASASRAPATWRSTPSRRRISSARRRSRHPTRPATSSTTPGIDLDLLRADQGGRPRCGSRRTRERRPERALHRGRQRPWEVPVDVAIPSATQNELDEADARALVANGVRAVAEGANMPCDARRRRARSRRPACSSDPARPPTPAASRRRALEMSQNAARQRWSFADSEAKLRSIMQGVHDSAFEAAERYGQPGRLRGRRELGRLRARRARDARAGRHLTQPAHVASRSSAATSCDRAVARRSARRDLQRWRRLGARDLARGPRMPSARATAGRSAGRPTR